MIIKIALKNTAGRFSVYEFNCKVSDLKYGAGEEGETRFTVEELHRLIKASGQPEPIPNGFKHHAISYFKPHQVLSVRKDSVITATYGPIVSEIKTLTSYSRSSSSSSQSGLLSTNLSQSTKPLDVKLPPQTTLTEKSSLKTLFKELLTTTQANDNEFYIKLFSELTDSFFLIRMIQHGLIPEDAYAAISEPQREQIIENGEDLPGTILALLKEPQEKKLNTSKEIALNCKVISEGVDTNTAELILGFLNSVSYTIKFTFFSYPKSQTTKQILNLLNRLSEQPTVSAEAIVDALKAKNHSEYLFYCDYTDETANQFLTLLEALEKKTKNPQALVELLGKRSNIEKDSKSSPPYCGKSCLQLLLPYRSAQFANRLIGFLYKLCDRKAFIPSSLLRSCGTHIIYNHPEEVILRFLNLLHTLRLQPASTRQNAQETFNLLKEIHPIGPTPILHNMITAASYKTNAAGITKNNFKIIQEILTLFRELCIQLGYSLEDQTTDYILPLWKIYHSATPYDEYSFLLSLFGRLTDQCQGDILFFLIQSGYLSGMINLENRFGMSYKENLLGDPISNKRMSHLNITLSKMDGYTSLRKFGDIYLIKQAKSMVCNYLLTLPDDEEKIKIFDKIVKFDKNKSPIPNDKTHLGKFFSIPSSMLAVSASRGTFRTLCETAKRLKDEMKTNKTPTLTSRK